MATQLDDRSEQDSPAVACFAHFIIKGKALIINAFTPLFLHSIKHSFHEHPTRHLKTIDGQTGRVMHQPNSDSCSPYKPKIYCDTANG